MSTTMELEPVTQIVPESIVMKIAAIEGLRKLENTIVEATAPLRETIAKWDAQRQQIVEQALVLRNALEAQMIETGAKTFIRGDVAALIEDREDLTITDESEVIAALTELGIEGEFTRTKVELKRNDVKKFAETREIPGVERVRSKRLRITGLN